MDQVPGLRTDLPRSAVTSSGDWAFIGTRRLDQVSQLAQDVYVAHVKRAVAAGVVVRTGAAKGADQLAAECALACGGAVIVVLPWASYERPWIASMEALHGDRIWSVVYDHDIYPAWFDSVWKYHPKAQYLKPYAIALHARNFGIIEPSSYVVAMPSVERMGGTEQGIRIAEGLGKPRLVIESLKKDDPLLGNVP